MGRNLHAINALRVIAEYLVVRHHVLDQRQRVGMDMFVRDLMSFFFVLSGFVMMHSHYTDDYHTLSEKLKFWVGRWKKTYPTYLLNLMFYIPLLISRASNPDYCSYTLICYFLQVFFLNSWAGCGLNILNALSWYLGTLVWLWAIFPFLHGVLIKVFTYNAWIKMLLFNIISSGVLCFFSGYNLFTFCPLPVLRMGEFVIGCGAACVLKRQQTAGSLTLNHWIPMLLLLLYLATVYIFLGMPHGVASICLHEEIQDIKCRLWHRSELIETSPPCLVIWDKFINKHAFIWAILIYTVARAEVVDDNSVIMHVLLHDIFKSIGSFSLSLYLGHMSVAWTLKKITDDVLGWADFWHDDVILLVIYFICYILHLLVARFESWFFCSDSYSKLLLLPSSDMEADQDDECEALVQTNLQN